MGASARCNNLDVQTFVPTKMLREQNISKFLVIRSKFHSHCVITSRPPSGHASRQWANASWNLGSLFKIQQRNCVLITQCCRDLCRRTQNIYLRGTRII